MTQLVNNSTAELAKRPGPAPLPPTLPRVQGEKPTGNKPDVFEFTDYRAYLKAFWSFKQQVNPAYSATAFAIRAGLGANSRGYLKLVIDGKRQLTPNTIRGFGEALGLNVREAMYFENLAFFNQAKKPKDRQYYFQRLQSAAEGNKTRQFEILESHFSYYSNWYIVAIRELVGLDTFEEDPAWIAARLRGKIVRKQAAEALVHLERLGLIRRNAQTGKLEQSDPLVKVTGDVFHELIQKFHSEMIDRAKEALFEDAHDERSTSCLTFSCDADRLPEMKKAIDEFRDKMNVKFGLENRKCDAIVQVNFQLFQLTAPRKISAQKNSAETNKGEIK